MFQVLSPRTVSTEVEKKAINSLNEAQIHRSPRV